MASKLPEISLSQSAEVAAACVRANVACLLLGPPGVGKTSIARAVGEAVKLPCVTLIASNMEATDFAGLPFVVDIEDGGSTRQQVQRALFPEIERATREPVLLFLDEITAIPRSVEAPMLRLALERNAGGRPLHPESRILMAGNEPEQAPGGITLSAAMTNRLVQVKVMPQINEIAGFFEGDPVVPDLSNLLSVEDAAEAYRNEAADFSIAAKHLSDLLQMSPPEDSIAEAAPWGSPRAWELGLRAYTALKRDYARGKGDMTGYALLCGSVGIGAGTAYLSHRELRANLPTPEQIAKAPDTAKVPDEKKYEIAAITVARRAAEIDFWGALVWLDRLPSNEIKRAGASLIAKSVTKQASKNPKWTKPGAEVFGRLVANVTAGLY